jgi:hypothetical protein
MAFRQRIDGRCRSDAVVLANLASRLEAPSTR